MRFVDAKRPENPESQITCVSLGFVLLCEPLHRADGPDGFDGLWPPLRFEFGRLLAVILVNSLTRERLLEPVEELSGRIDLVVVLALWEYAHLVQIFGEPSRRFRDMHKAVLDQR